MNELHLKFHSETGSYHTDYPKLRDYSDEYIEWIEELALKQIKQVKINADGAKATKKFDEIKSCFEALKSEINSIDPNDVERYEIDAIVDSCDTLESVIYD